MTYVVAFDGSDLSCVALSRARRFASAVGQDLVAVTVVPAENAEYASEHGWLDEGEPFDGDEVVACIEAQVRSVAPEAEVRVESVDRFAPKGTIAKQLRRIAKELSAEVVFVGSANAGRIVGSLFTVGGSVASDASYDVHIVRTLD